MLSNQTNTDFCISRKIREGKRELKQLTAGYYLALRGNRDGIGNRCTPDKNSYKPYHKRQRQEGYKKEEKGKKAAQPQVAMTLVLLLGGLRRIHGWSRYDRINGWAIQKIPAAGSFIR